MKFATLIRPLHYWPFSTIIVPAKSEMKVSLKLMQPLSGLVGGKALLVEVGGDSLGDLIEQLSREHGPAVAKELLDQEGGLDSAYVVSVDGTLVRSISAKLREGAEVLIFASIVGGVGAP